MIIKIVYGSGEWKKIELSQNGKAKLVTGAGFFVLSEEELKEEDAKEFLRRELKGECFYIGQVSPTSICLYEVGGQDD